MTYTVKVDIPGAPKGADVMIPGLGTFKNGEPGTVEDDKLDIFVNFQNTTGEERTLEEVLEGAEFLSITKTTAKAKTSEGGDK